MAQHHIRAAYGISEQHYGTEFPPYQGLGQGNGYDPTEKGHAQYANYQYVAKQRFGLKITSPTTKKLVEIVCYVFVDDTDLLYAVVDNNSTAESILNEMQECINH